MRIVAALLALLGVFLLLDGPHWGRTLEDVQICESVNRVQAYAPSNTSPPEDCRSTTDPKYAIGCFLLAGLCLFADRRPAPVAPSVAP